MILLLHNSSFLQRRRVESYVSDVEGRPTFTVS